MGGNSSSSKASQECSVIRGRRGDRQPGEGEQKIQEWTQLRMRIQFETETTSGAGPEVRTVTGRAEQLQTARWAHSSPRGEQPFQTPEKLKQNKTNKPNEYGRKRHKFRCNPEGYLDA